MISIIIPLYNKEKSISNTLRSLLEQTNPNWECIVVDDGSTDKSAEVIKNFTDSRIRYYKKKNGGVSSARNFGSEKANGDYFLFLDADDFLLPDCVNVFYTLLKNSPNQDIYTCNFYIEKNGNKDLFIKKQYEGNVGNGMKDLFLLYIYMRPGAYIIKSNKAILCPFDEELSRYEDMEIQLRYIKTCKIFSHKRPVMIYQSDDNCLSLKRDRYHKDFLSRLIIKNNMKFWERLFYYKCMYIAIRNYPFQQVLRYFIFLPHIVFAKMLYYIIHNKII